MIRTRGLMQWWSRIRRKHGGVQHYGIKYICWFFYVNIFQGFETMFAGWDVRLSCIRVYCVRQHGQQDMGSEPDRDTSRISASLLILRLWQRVVICGWNSWLHPQGALRSRTLLLLQFVQLVCVCSISSLKLQWSLCVEDPKVLRSSYPVLCVLCRSQNK
jgi:hypothetical protein